MNKENLLLDLEKAKFYTERIIKLAKELLPFAYDDNILLFINDVLDNLDKTEFYLQRAIDQVENGDLDNKPLVFSTTGNIGSNTPNHKLHVVQGVVNKKHIRIEQCNMELK